MASRSIRVLKNVSGLITSAFARSWTMVAKTGSKSRSVLAFSTWSCSPRARAAGCKARKKPSAILGLVIDQQSNDGRCGYQFAQQFQPLRPHLYVQVRYAGQVAAGPVEAGDKPNLDRVD